MTTLHEEPSSLGPRQTLTEEVEDSYSDPEEAYNDNVASKPQLKSKFPTSKTMGSLRDIGNSYMSGFNVSSTASSITSNNVTITSTTKHIAGTPSMTSSTSSGYGSQAVSYSNLTNDDSLSVRSMSVDTPGKKKTFFFELHLQNRISFSCSLHRF